MTCPFCQSPNPDGAAHCNGCGRALDVPLAKGTLFASRYEIQQELGTGGMGTVYKAYDRALDDSVALKVLRADITDAEVAWRFQAEIRLARKVTHRNVCRMYDYGEVGALRYISMEFVAGTDLRKLVHSQGGLSHNAAFDVALEIAAGLQAIHEVGIIHRDLKAQNVMLDSRGLVRIMDFGISKEWGTQATAIGMVIGTPEYMSPEQAQGEPIGFATDVYALGILVFELFTGQVPFRSDNPITTLHKQVHEPPPLEGPAAAKIPPAVVPVLRIALAKDPASRHESVRAFADALRQARDQAQPTLFLHAAAAAPAPRVSSAPAPPTPKPRPQAAPAPAAPAAPPAAEPAASRPRRADSTLPALFGALDQIIALVNATTGVPQLIGLILTVVRGFARAQVGRLVVLEIAPSGGALVEACSGHGSDRLRGTRLGPGEGLALKVAEQGRALRSADASREKGYSAAVDELPASKEGFIALPLVSGTFRGALLLAGRDGGFGAGEEEDLARLARCAAVAIESAIGRERTIDAFTHNTELLVSFLQRTDTRYPMHSRSVAAIADVITAGFGCGEEEQRHIHFGALLHDIGKLGLDPTLLNADRELDDEERRTLQQHVVLGVQLVSPITPWKEVTRIIEAHHERWDGKGYPRGLKGEEIPFGARVVAVADALDAMTSNDPLRPAEDILTELQDVAGAQFDPAVVQALVAEHRRRAALLKG
jgi:putative nucleotidyltransferase with HDIG domain